MPKVKRGRVADAGANVIGGRDVQKLQRLLRQNVDEELTPSKRFKTQDEDSSDSESLESGKELTADHEAPLELPHSDIADEYKADWENFFGHSEVDKEYITQLQKNLTEAKLKITDEVSQFSGSVPGDLEDFKGVDDLEELPEELLSHLRLLMDVLKHYRSGPLPKTVKMLPHLPAWEGLLGLLKPLEWTVHAYPRIVKIFASKGHEPALHFYENYLLPKVKQDIEENRRLCVQLFEALIASMFRPEEFVSGVFLPWIQSEMSKTEGVILAHLIKKATLKARFAAVALALSLEEEFSIPRSMVIEALLSKHYHMPEAALERVLQYFLSFDKDCSVYFTHENRMPVTWFRSLLLFLESYRNYVKPEERTKLVKLCRQHEHPQITGEIRTLLSLISTNNSATT
ncbi:Essential nuclear protein 1 [Paragonimus heterotremus]|uniref:Essential nuclear protein 1 n=1 Tax=Paragonimus heterotremus TaxID=100268 RepID=A0A8J4SYH0_9TREM|nr:Essential nuclear protein 1 [Paragonimus heterotremus]